MSHCSPCLIPETGELLLLQYSTSAADLQWPGVYSVSHDSKHLELPDLLNIQRK